MPPAAAAEGGGSPARFVARELHASGALRPATLGLAGSAGDGWTLTRDGRPALTVGPGFELLQTLACGVCATDLARPHLPFPLPQVVGHEVVARDARGQRCVVEINASHRARGVAACAFCRQGLDRHCPERLVLGIDRLPGGFGPWLLAPRHAILPVPDALPADTAVLVEPFAAALRAVATVAPRAGDRVAVLGPRRLGLLVIAALRAWRARHGVPFTIVALARRQELLARARELGADETQVLGPRPEPCEVVLDTSGSPDALTLALEIATREVHVKSTHGRPAAGLEHVTELVVDELRMAPLPADARALPRSGAAPPLVVWLAPDPPPAWLEAAADVRVYEDPAAALAALERDPSLALARADAVAVASLARADQAIRPVPGRGAALLRPGGELWLHPSAAPQSPLEQALLRRGSRISTSRCGDFAAALELLADQGLRELGPALITHRFPPQRLAAAFAAAAAPESVKVVVEHG